MEKLIAILGTLAVVAGPVGAITEQINPEVGIAIGAAGGVALAVTKPLVDLQAKLAERKAKKSRQRAAKR